MAQSAVAFLLTKLGCFIEEELKSLGVKGDIVFIRDKLQSMSAFLRVANAIKDTDPEIQAWVKGRVDEWKLVNRSLGGEVEGSDMKKILLLSYNDLPYSLKSCLLYLSSFPEDHLID
ncbi:hypothetical protein ACSBR2_033504 [Camellia fascicularis]